MRNNVGRNIFVGSLNIICICLSISGDTKNDNKRENYYFCCIQFAPRHHNYVVINFLFTFARTYAREGSGGGNHIISQTFVFCRSCKLLLFLLHLCFFFFSDDCLMLRLYQMYNCANMQNLNNMEIVKV